MMDPLNCDYTFTADKSQYQPPQRGVSDPEGRVYYPYVPSKALKEAVNLAIALKRPLLLEGEPGCGKTRLAGAVVYEFTKKYLKGKKDEQDNPLWWDYYIWNVKSSSRARDGLYTFDAVARLRDAQLIGSDPERLQQYLEKDEYESLAKRLRNKTLYRTFGPLGEALQQTEYRPIVLIDEIDKADSDFPNDLLLELDEMRFEIPETGEKVPRPEQQTVKPIIIITSNREKPLPDPFLRRCLYFYVDFPDKDRLIDIITKRFGKLNRTQKQLVTVAIEHFEEIRELLQDQPGSRPPGTSEILEFLTAIWDQPIEIALQEIKTLAKRSPLLGILLKTRKAQQIYSKAYPGEENG